MKASVSQKISRSHGIRAELLVPLHKGREWDSQALASDKIGTIYIHKDQLEIYRPVARTPTIWGNPNLPPPWGPSRESVSSEAQFARKRTYQEDYIGSSRQDLVPIPSDLICCPYTIHVYVDAKTKLDESRLSSIPFKKASSIIIEGLTPHISNLLGRILSPFGRLERIILVDVWPSVVETMALFIKRLTYLQIKIKSLVAFDLAPLLCSTLEELDIQHENAATFLPLQAIIELPSLRRLHITLHEHSLWPRLRLPMLKELSFHASASAAWPGQIFQISEERKPLQLAKISFYKWLDAKTPIPLEVIDRFVGNQRLNVEISSCIINSTDLMSTVDKDPRIKTITIAHCTGITQAECEILKGKVEKINVYI